jgi:hypothetical protein
VSTKRRTSEKLFKEEKAEEEKKPRQHKLMEKETLRYQ